VNADYSWHVIPGDSGREYSIKEVLTLLQGEFPDITISKIRFLESKGLIAPERNSSGYRRFYKADIERLRAVLAMQRSTYMPLRKIREALDNEPETERPGLFSSPPPPPTQVDPPARAKRDSLYSADELCRDTKIDPQVLESLHQHGLIQGVMVGSVRFYQARDVEMATLARRFLAYGLEPRHLRVYRTTSEREVGFLEQVVAPLLAQKNPRAREKAVKTLADLREAGALLRDRMISDAFEALGVHLGDQEDVTPSDD